MARVNISLPDRLVKIAAFDQYVGELEAELGPPTDEQLAEAKEWAEKVFGPAEASGKTA